MRISKTLLASLAAVGALTTWALVDNPKPPPEPVPGEPIAILGEFALAHNAPDVQRWRTPQGGFYMRSDSLAVEWEMRQLDPVRPFQRFFLSQDIQPDSEATVWHLSPQDTLHIQIPAGDWFIAVEDTNYGLSGFQKFVADPCDSLACFAYPPATDRTSPEPVYAMIGGRESNLRFPTHEVDYLYRDRVNVRHLGEGINYLRFGAYDVPTKSWLPYGGLVELEVMPCGWVPPEPPPAGSEGPDLTRAWWANGWTFRFAFEDSLGSETSSIDPATVEQTDFQLTHNGVPVPLGTPNFHWGWYWSFGGTQAPGAWKFRVDANSVADTMGVYNSQPDSVEWVEP